MTNFQIVTTIPATRHLDRPGYLLVTGVRDGRDATLLIPDNPAGRSSLAALRRRRLADVIATVSATAALSAGILAAFIAFVFLIILLGIDPETPDRHYSVFFLLVGPILAIAAIGAITTLASSLSVRSVPDPIETDKRIGLIHHRRLDLRDFPPVEGRDALPFLADAAWEGVLPAALTLVKKNAAAAEDAANQARREAHARDVREQDARDAAVITRLLRGRNRRRK